MARLKLDREAAKATRSQLREQVRMALEAFERETEAWPTGLGGWLQYDDDFTALEAFARFLLEGKKGD